MMSNNNFVKLSKATVNIDNITFFTNNSLYFTSGETISLSTMDRIKLEKAMGIAEDDTTTTTTSTTSKNTSIFYKKLVVSLNELNKHRYAKFTVTMRDNKIIISSDVKRETNEYTIEGICISNGLDDRDVDEIVAEALM